MNEQILDFPMLTKSHCALTSDIKPGNDLDSAFAQIDLFLCKTKDIISTNEWKALGIPFRN